MIYAKLLVRGKIYITLTSKNSSPAKHPFMPVGNRWSPIYDRKGDLCGRYEELLKHMNQGIIVGLLQGVSKAIQREAEDVFYSAANRFIVPVGTFEYPVVIGGMPGPIHRVLRYQSISYSFDRRQVDEDQYTLFHETKDESNSLHGDPSHFDNLTPDQKRSLVHDHYKREAMSIWAEICETITEKMKLQFLQLDFDHCRCPMGCCRMLEDVCGNLVDFPNGFPNRIEILGASGLQEWEIVVSFIGRSDAVQEERIKFVQ